MSLVPSTFKGDGDLKKFRLNPSIRKKKVSNPQNDDLRCEEINFKFGIATEQDDGI